MTTTMAAKRRNRKRKLEWFGPLQALLLGLAIIVVGLAAEQAWLAPLLSHAITGR